LSWRHGHSSDIEQGEKIKRPSTFVRTIVLTIGFVYSSVLVASGQGNGSLLKALTNVLPVLSSVLLVIWDLWVWRWPIVRRLTHRPRIDGLWTGSITPTAKSLIPNGGNRGPISNYLIIRQSFWSLHIRQYTAESSSDSKTFLWERIPGTAVDRLTFLYQNQPRPSELLRSTLHSGCCAFDNQSLTPRLIQGVYFTNRYTQGEMNLSLVDRSYGYGSFDEADSHVKEIESGKGSEA